MPLDVIGVVLGVASLVSAFGIYFFDVRRKLDELLRAREGILNKSQAHDLTALYLESVKSRLLLALRHYADNDLPGHFERGEADRIVLELKSAYDKVVRQSVRPMVTTFRLRGRHRFDDFVSNISRKSVDQAFVGAQAQLVEAINNSRPLSEVIARIERLVDTVSNQGNELMLKRIDQLYPRDADV